MTDDLDQIFERLAREEQDDIATKHGQHILDAVVDIQTRPVEGDPLYQLLDAMYAERVREAKKDADT